MSERFSYIPKKRKQLNSGPESTAKRVKNEEAPRDESDGISSSKQKLPAKSIPSTSRSLAKSNEGVQAAWSISQLLAELENLRPTVAENIVQLFEQDNTIPFICRYRRHLVGNLEPDRMREIKTSLGQVTQLRAKVASVAKTLEKENLLTEDLKEAICTVKSMEELNHVYELYKPAKKKSLVEKATNLGLKPVAEMLLSGKAFVNFEKHVDPSVGPLSTVNEVKAGVAILVSSMIMKNSRLLDFIRERRKTARIELHSSQAKAKPSEEHNPQDATKYELYFNFSCQVSQIRPHQILAINRGEKNKILTVKIVIPTEMQMNIERFVMNLYRAEVDYSVRTEFLKKIVSEMYSKKVVPLITKEVRRELSEKAEKASIEVFANNLRQLLLMCPVKGVKILGIDPGFAHGCKMAMISEQGSVLETLVIYPHTKRADSADAMDKLADIMRRHGCKTIALGNGTACRETETFLEKAKIRGKLDFTYCITSEQGASIYSCSDVAKREFPTLDVNLIGAVSIARRLGNPLAELVKVEPKHLGVGMYQHDVSEKLLGESLQEIVVECVSFVGVDVNTASESLLQFVAGLTPARAKNIIEYRQKHGSIGSREELKKVKLIGEKSFTQCAGFIRVDPRTSGKVNDPLDGTWVHPESYQIARAIIEKLSLDLRDLGKFDFIESVKNLAGDLREVENIAKNFGTLPECVKTVCEALQRLPSMDYRDDLNRRSHFKQKLTKMIDLKPGTLATGSITNVTHFGCFVDLGVEKSGLIHTKNLRGLKPGIGDSVEVSILSVDTNQGRIQLSLEKIF
ncbi:S1 RNA-binding domain-containing protein 1 isoform X2 [Phlebotomus papatasi]|uniref:S1 RNA-binding domain-containing protein 1 isoform X2 n=1 Tax=Phlebotomus papatasi TaxID=29031 RepID=UPI0024839AA5|nr:S1 RNA-binding domain-containing protein 1 isoform X2 [Phlebotomus papatasi]